jgi:starch synthase
MKLLYVTSEAAPFAASGGLGDVMGALPPEMKRRSPSDDVRVILPYYKQKMADKYASALKKVSEFHFSYGWRSAYCAVYALEFEGVVYYFVDNEQYFDRPALYGQFDDGERFAYFSLAVVEFLIRSDFRPDVLHANDWQTALTVVYLKTKFASVEELSGIQTVFTIHNIEYQGKFDLSILGDIFALDSAFTSIVEYDGCINLMKGAIVCADRVTTVSPNYANEIRQSFFAYGLQHVINLYGYKLSGIINGIDTAYFSPSTGGDIPFAYDASSVAEGKRKNRAALMGELGLEDDPNAPLVAMITRLTHGKGVDLLLHIFDEMMEQNVRFVLLGTGDAEYERLFSELCARYPGKARAEIRFDRALSKRIYAAADIFLMPSKSEPCGLAQMIACAYGTVPIVRAVGGLYDTIKPDVNGFVFTNFNAHELLYRIKDAVALYRSEADWSSLRASAMASDFTWSASAARYADLYRLI